jgi:hypothetical protein
MANRYVGLLAVFEKWINKARREGLLSLEAINPDMWKLRFSDPLYLGLQLICDGQDPNDVQSILENYLLSSKFSFEDEMYHRMIISGILDLQRGINARTLLAKLISLIPKEHRDLELKEFWDNHLRSKPSLIFEKCPYNEKVAKIVDKYTAEELASIILADTVYKDILLTHISGEKDKALSDCYYSSAKPSQALKEEFEKNFKIPDK